jgi:hypothetical protein
MGKTVLETFTIFPFSIILTLALGEAFRQTIAEDGNIRKDRIFALLTFLSFILPFYQGMNRYLLQTYGGTPTPQFAPVFLIIDGVSFMAESAIFFAMSRNLANDRWAYFYSIVIVLLIVDSCWGISALQHASEGAKTAIRSWITLNFITSGILLFALVGLVLSGKYQDILGSRYANAVVAGVATIGMVIRTTFDYVISWDFYFS